VKNDTGGVRCTHPSEVCIYREQDAALAQLREENDSIKESMRMTNALYEEGLDREKALREENERLTIDSFGMKSALSNQMQMVGELKEMNNNLRSRLAVAEGKVAAYFGWKGEKK
jgi:hypothetical protein